MSAQTFKNYINGEWVGAAKTFENRNPANTEEVVGLFSKGTAQGVAEAAAAAASAFPASAAMPAPALICGNTVVLKPASAAPLSAWRIVEALHEAGVPKGVVNFVAGSG